MSQQETPDKRKMKLDESQMRDVFGYVHNVSPIKISEKNNSFFTCRIQTEDDVNDMVCLSPDKWKYFQKAEREDSGVLVKNVRCQLENRKKKLFTNYMSSIVTVTEPLAFEKREQLMDEIQIKTIRIEDVILKPLDMCGFYSICGKVINLGKAVDVMIFGTQKKCQSVVLTDGTHKLVVSVYGPSIDMMEVGKCYKIDNVSLRNNNNVKKITFRKQTVVNEVSNFELTGNVYDVGKNDKDMQVILLDIAGVRADLKVKCPICSTDYDYATIKHEATVRCTHCVMLTKSSKLVTAMSVKVDGSDENGENKKLIIRNCVITDFLKGIDKIHLVRDAKGLEEFLIKQNEKMHVVSENMIVSAISFDAIVD